LVLSHIALVVTLATPSAVVHAQQRPRLRRCLPRCALLAVDVLVGAFSSLFDIAVLVAGDTDFVPVVEEAKRRGVMVVIVAAPGTLAEDLRRVADRHIAVTPQAGLLHPLK